MDPLRGLPGVAHVHRDRGQQRRNGENNFESELEQQPTTDEEAESRRQRRKPLQIIPRSCRNTPSDGEFHIDVLA